MESSVNNRSSWLSLRKSIKEFHDDKIATRAATSMRDAKNPAIALTTRPGDLVLVLLPPEEKQPIAPATEPSTSNSPYDMDVAITDTTWTIPPYTIHAVPIPISMTCSTPKTQEVQHPEVAAEDDSVSELRRRLVL